MSRPDGRAGGELRAVAYELGYQEWADGSVLFSMGFHVGWRGISMKFFARPTESLARPNWFHVRMSHSVLWA